MPMLSMDHSFGSRQTTPEVPPLRSSLRSPGSSVRGKSARTSGVVTVADDASATDVWSPDDPDSAKDLEFTPAESFKRGESPGSRTRSSRHSMQSMKSTQSVLSHASTITSGLRRAWNQVRQDGDLQIESMSGFDSSYIAHKNLGAGSYGTVQLISSKRSGKFLAMKCVKHNKHTRDELGIFKVLDNPYIVRLHNILQDKEEETLYFVMDYCAGGDLAGWIKLRQEVAFCDAPKIYRAPETWLAAGILWQMLVGIGYLHHHRMIHRDVKPENYLILDELEEMEDGMCRVKLSDFGLACKYAKGERKKDRAGSLPYMAPEVLNGSYDQGCDIWGVGACIYLVVCDAHWFCRDDADSDRFNTDDEEALNAQIWASIVQNDVTFQRPVWKRHPSEFRDIVASLLCKSEALRASARGLVSKNKWLRNHGKSSAEAVGCCCAVQ